MAKANSKHLIEIPAPDFDADEVVFHPIVRGFGKNIPFGYEVSEEDDQILNPIPEQLWMLEKARSHLKKGFSLRDVANWLTTRSGRSISHQGLKVRLAQDTTRNKKYGMSKRMALMFAEAYMKARKLEDSRLGKKEPLPKTLLEELLEIAGETQTN